MFGNLLCGFEELGQGGLAEIFSSQQTAWICVVLWLSAGGSARRKTRFAILPGSMTLESFASNLLSPPARNLRD